MCKKTKFIILSKNIAFYAKYNYLFLLLIKSSGFVNSKIKNNDFDRDGVMSFHLIHITQFDHNI